MDVIGESGFVGEQAPAIIEVLMTVSVFVADPPPTMMLVAVLTTVDVVVLVTLRVDVSITVCVIGATTAVLVVVDVLTTT